MSKAFTRDENEGPEDLGLPERETLLPDGARNYLTAEGAERLRAELARLVGDERPPLLAALPDPDAKRQLAKLHERLSLIEQSLERAEIVDAPTDRDRVGFGSKVTVRESSGEEVEYRIVGVDETDFENGLISWTSPLAKALLQRRAGETVTLDTPGGVETLEILQIAN